MNLHQIVRGAIGAVNPFVLAQVQVSTGSGMDPSGSGRRIPVYAPARPARVQVQALEDGELRQLDGLNIQGIKRAIYLNGRWDGLVRVDRKGGDLVTMLNGDKWLVVLVLEYWPDWCKVAVTLQNGS